MANRLADALSPYLRQHADNPVDWWQWSPEAMQEARERDVPILLSIGYSACHWCHVMAHESFSDPEIAELLNSHTVPVKVDREERPDIDQIYMDATVALTGHGGWPMTVWLTPDGHPFHAGTYYPPEPRQGLASFRQVIEAVLDAWQSRRAAIVAGAPMITEQLAARTRLPDPMRLTYADAEVALDRLAEQLDPVNGGFGGAPKFPPTTVLDALVRRAAQADGDGADTAWSMVEQTADAMISGGMYDQLGGGFARYSVDARWLVPHFEKMLYDNALLIGTYARTAVEAERRGRPSEAYRRVVGQTIDWLTREMLTEEGALASSLDADSLPEHDAEHAHEGAFYAWTPAQLVAALGPADGARAAEVFGVTEAGTFEGGASVLQRPRDLDDADAAWIAQVAGRLLQVRAGRPRPARDDKVVTAWNGWAILSLVEAAMLLEHPPWLDLAAQVAGTVVDRHWRGGALARVSLAGEVSTASATAEDHGALAHALALLAAATGTGSWLTVALEVAESVHSRFAAPDGGLYDTAEDAETLVRRPREIAETVTPSGAGAVLAADRVLHRLTGDHRWAERADALARTTAALAITAPRAAGWALADAIAETGPRRPVEVAVVGEADDPTLVPLVVAAWRAAPPGSVVVTGLLGPAESTIPLLADRYPLAAATAYVCHAGVCDLPVVGIEAMLPRLG